MQTQVTSLKSKHRPILSPTPAGAETLRCPQIPARRTLECPGLFAASGEGQMQSGCGRSNPSPTAPSGRSLSFSPNPPLGICPIISTLPRRREDREQQADEDNQTSLQREGGRYSRRLTRREELPEMTQRFSFKTFVKGGKLWEDVLCCSWYLFKPSR